jgi:hypothetical protein
MRLTRILGFLAAATAVSGYIVTVFAGHGCTGQSQLVQVKSHTCRIHFDFEPILSVRVDKYGGRGQRARFHRQTHCGLLYRAKKGSHHFNNVEAGPWKASKPNYSWVVGNCLNHTIKAMGSFAV